MNSIRVSDGLRKIWLEIKVGEITETHTTVTCQMFDGTPFTVTVPKAKVEVDPTDAKIGLMEVGYVGDGSGYSEIILPAPALNYGHTVRVQGHQLVRRHPVVYPTKYKRED